MKTVKDSHEFSNLGLDDLSVKTDIDSGTDILKEANKNSFYLL